MVPIKSTNIENLLETEQNFTFYAINYSYKKGEEEIEYKMLSIYLFIYLIQHGASL